MIRLVLVLVKVFKMKERVAVKESTDILRDADPRLDV
jgi:hypothetical protein